MPAEPALRQFPASLDAMQDALAFVGSVCETEGIAMPVQLRVELVVEELFTNTVMHGSGPAGDACDIWIAAAVEAETMRLEYQDSAAPFNPLADIRVPTYASPDDMPVGGLGRLLVARLATTAAYRREHNRNVLDLSFAAA